jgi:hypothetical protein
MLSFGRAVSATACAAVCVILSALLAGGCSNAKTSLTVEVAPGDDLPPIVRVDVTATSAGHEATVTATGSGGGAVTWPTTVALNVTGFPRGDAIIEATAFDDTQTMVARGTTSVALPASGRVAIALRCQSLTCSKGGADGGVDAPAGADAESDSSVIVSPTCGNGRLDPGETCDVARAAELPGACPATCDDGIPCTRDEGTGDVCTISCTHIEITSALSGDACCPAYADQTTDSDCSANCGNQRVDPGETCDTAISSGPGSCPSADSCDDRDPCTRDQLISAATCSARCAHTLILAAIGGDGCCPVGADVATDRDCRAACGNGILEPGELCEVGLASGSHSCPTLADCDDTNPCTVDSLSGTGCQAACSHRIIDGPAPADGCCPMPGLAKSIDSDCPALCGNGVLEEGETCDRALPPGSAGACPPSCPASPSACLDYVMQGSASACTTACVATPVGICYPIADGCCPTGCTRATDPDCSASCGNGTVEAGETCDTGISTGVGACSRTCADGIACTDDLVIDAGTCNARCLFIATTTLRDGDGCCLPGAHAGVDADCPASCGNGIVESPWETCDTGTVPASCPTACPPPEACATWTRTAASGCDVRCARRAITSCANGDGCCAPGCNASNDSDCVPRCGNGLVEPPETCDRGITAGHAGACSATCVDSDPCTLDVAQGNPESCSRACSHIRITACAAGDRCCPAGCGTDTDSDCFSLCNDGHVQAQETCDPRVTCPTSCASDGDPCTVDQLVGSADICSAACAHVPILRCSGTQRDGCCPTDCNATSDSDC